MTNKEKVIFNNTKDIVIAYLSNSSSTSPDKTTGKGIGEMFEEIYNKLIEIANIEE